MINSFVYTYAEFLFGFYGRSIRRQLRQLGTFTVEPEADLRPSGPASRGLGIL